MRQSDCRPARCVGASLAGDSGARARAARRRPRAGQDADDPHRGGRDESDLQPRAIHSGPHAVRHHRHRSSARRPNDGSASFRFVHGPLFAHVVLADEINRTPPKTQAALLEAMQERQITVAGQRHRLPDPFFVLATQNPIEQEGTYPLPEAQLDRFMLQIQVDYPNENDEFAIVQATTSGDPRPLSASSRRLT